MKTLVIDWMERQWIALNVFKCIYIYGYCSCNLDMSHIIIYWDLVLKLIFSTSLKIICWPKKSEFQKQLITGGVLVKNVFFEISQNLQENTGAFHSGHVRVSFFIKLLPQACNFIKKRLWHRCFPVNFAKFLGTPFLQNTSGWLLLEFLV